MNYRRPTYGSLPGVVSGAALTEHVKLYDRYVAGAESSEHNLAGAILHDLYFTGFSPKPSPISLPVLRSAVQDRWGTTDAWWRDMREAALAAHGWALLSARGSDLRVLALEKHDDAVPGYEPIVAVDAYEHAYWLDYGTRKGEYLDALYRVLDWPELERRWAEYLR